MQSVDILTELVSCGKVCIVLYFYTLPIVHVSVVAQLLTAWGWPALTEYVGLHLGASGPAVLEGFSL